MSMEEGLMLKAAITCKVCEEPCSKAVSLACCGSASCRKCALAKIKEDKTKCWGCGELSGDVNTPSQLVNNDLVSFFIANHWLGSTSRATVEIFVLLSNREQRSEVSEEVKLYDEPNKQEHSFSHFGVRDIFTGTGSSSWNRKLGMGKRKWDRTTIQKFCENGTGVRQRYKAPGNRGLIQLLRGQPFVPEGTDVNSYLLQ